MKKIILVFGLVFGLGLVVGCSNPAMMPASMMNTYDVVEPEEVIEEPKKEEIVEEIKTRTVLSYDDVYKEDIEEVVNDKTNETIQKTYYNRYDEKIKVEYYENNKIVKEERFIYYFYYDVSGKWFSSSCKDNCFYTMELDKDGNLLRALKRKDFTISPVEVGDTVRYNHIDNYGNIPRKDDTVFKYDEVNNKYYLSVVGDNGNEYDVWYFINAEHNLL